jgi:hypothetical protein
VGEGQTKETHSEKGEMLFVGFPLDSFLFCFFFLFSCCAIGAPSGVALLRLRRCYGRLEMHQSRGMRCTRSEVETMLNLL